MIVAVMITAVPYLHTIFGGYVKILLLYSLIIIAYEFFTGQLRETLKEKTSWLLIGFSFSYTITLFINRESGLNEGIKSFVYVLVFFVLFYMTRKGQTKKSVIKELQIISATIIFCTFILSLISLLTYAFSISGRYLNNNGVYVYYGLFENRLWGLYNPNTGASLNCISLLLSIGFIATSRKKIITFFNLINVFLQFSCLLLTGSRAGYYTLLLLLVFLTSFWVFKKHTRLNLRVLSVMIACSIMLSGLYIGTGLLLKEGYAYLPNLIQVNLSEDNSNSSSSDNDSTTQTEDDTNSSSPENDNINQTEDNNNSSSSENDSTNQTEDNNNSSSSENGNINQTEDDTNSSSSENDSTNQTEDNNNSSSSENDSTNQTENNNTPSSSENDNTSQNKKPGNSKPIPQKQDFTRLEELENREGGFFNGRVVMWKACLEAFKESPLFGVGNENLITRSLAHLKDTDWAEHFRTGGSHNIYICLLTSTGIIGFLLIGVFAALTFIKSIIVLLKNKKTSSFWLPISICICLLFYISEFVEARILFQVSTFSVIFWLFVGYMYRLAKLEEQDTKK